MAMDEHFHARQLSLIKTARALEQDGTKSLGDKIDDIWPVLTAAKGSKSSVAEEIVLRWFLKHMDGATEDAERVRRYPPTWSILGELFERISLFSLSKIFLERRFVAVLQQSARDISGTSPTTDAKPGVNGEAKSAKTHKRKRGAAIPFDTEGLRLPATRMESARRLFSTLNRLVSRLNGPMGQRAEDVVVGAEHVKALLRTTAQETKDLLVPLLVICDQAVDILENGLSEDQHRWVKVVVSIWNLHLGARDDAFMFAIHLYRPSASILAKLKGLRTRLAIPGNQAVEQLWIRQLEQFLLKNLVNPARTDFANNNSFMLLFQAIEAKGVDPVSSAQILWDLAIRTRRDSDDPSSRKAHASWAQNVFPKLLKSLENAHSADGRVISNMLSCALKANSAPDVETLRRVCNDYAFATENTDWTLLSKIIRCEPDVFISDESNLKRLLHLVTFKATQDERYTIASGVVNPLMEAYSTVRNLPGFVRIWHGELAKSKDIPSGAWFEPSIRRQFSRIMQDALSTQQLSKLVDELGLGVVNFSGTQSETPGAALVVLDAICDGLTPEDFDHIGMKLFETAFPASHDRLPPALMALRWRIAAKTAAQVMSGHVNEIWARVRDALHGQLTKNPLSDPATLEAFGCCCQLWLANYSGKSSDADISSLAQTFLEKLKAHTKDEKADAVELLRYLDMAFACRLFEDERLLKLMVTSFGSLNSRLDDKNHGLISDLVHKADFEESITAEAALLDPLVKSLEGSENLCGWTRPQGRLTVATLLDFPMQSFTKEHRKRIMLSWKKWRSAIADEAGLLGPGYAKSVLYLLLKTMSRPTFYQNMEFDDVLEFSANMPTSSDVAPLLEDLARLVLSQVIGKSEQPLPSYLNAISKYVKELDPSKSDQNIHLGLLKSIVSVLKREDSAKASDVSPCLAEAVEKLTSFIEHNTSQFASEWKKSKKTPEIYDSTSSLISRTLNAVDAVKEDLKSRPIKLSSKMAQRLNDAAETLSDKGVEVGWKLRVFLARNQNGLPDSETLVEQLSKPYSRTPEKAVIVALVETFIRDQDVSDLLGLLGKLICKVEARQYSTVSLMAVMIVIERIPTSTAGLAAPTASLITLTEQTTHVDQFETLVQILQALLDKHAPSMTQSSIDATVASIATTCSPRGPNISGPQQQHAAAGRVYHGLCQLLATVIKRHRLRLEGRHHLLLGALQALLRVLLTDPVLHGQGAAADNASSALPPWLLGAAPLQARHAAKFTRLVTLICEPSAAAVAHVHRNNKTKLDSATDAAKRSAGGYMHWVLAAYVGQLLREEASRDAGVRRQLEAGMFSVLTVTPEGNRDVLNEALDADGRVIFGRIYRDYKRFGKWSGV